MTKCVRDQSRRYLSGDLSAAEESAFIEHLDVCRNCQSWLEEAAGGDEAWQLTRELLAISCTKDSGTNSMSNLIDEEHSAKLSNPELALLHPSDDPAMLGRLGSLEVIGVLGRGGMGVVFKCFDPILRRNVAVKLLDPVLANLGAARQRFARSARHGGHFSRSCRAYLCGR